nr:hypothetical protein CFP56_51674 [Quercus suber]
MAGQASNNGEDSDPRLSYDKSLSICTVHKVTLTQPLPPIKNKNMIFTQQQSLSNQKQSKSKLWKALYCIVLALTSILMTLLPIVTLTVLNHFLSLPSINLCAFFLSNFLCFWFSFSVSRYF